MAKVDNKEHQERVYQVGLLLRRKPMAYIIEYIISEWGLKQAQAYNYIKEAREEWKKYFAKLKKDGMSYHISQMRDLKDKAFNDGDTRLAFDVSKEEAKLTGSYPVTKIDFEDVNVKFELVSPDKDKEDKEKEE